MTARSGRAIQRKDGEFLDIQESISRKSWRVAHPPRRGRGETRSKHLTDNVEAYQPYFKGCYSTEQFTQESVNKGIDYFEQAIAKIRSYARLTPAWPKRISKSRASRSRRRGHARTEEAASKASALMFPRRASHPDGDRRRRLRRRLFRCRARIRRGTEFNLGRLCPRAVRLCPDGHGSQRRCTNRTETCGRILTGSPIPSGSFTVRITSLGLVRSCDSTIAHDDLGRSELLVRAFLLGWVLARTGKDDEAISSLNEAVRLGASPYAQGYWLCRRDVGENREGSRSAGTNGVAVKKSDVLLYQIAMVYVGRGEREKVSNC